MVISPQSRSFNVDLIRVVAAVMVVLMHTIYNFTLRTDFFATKLWWLLEPIAVFSKTCVLLFFMLSGYLVINKKRTIKENWLKAKQRILIPLVFFETLNVAYAAYLYHFNISNTWDFWQGQIIRLTNHPNSPLWFLVVLFYLYLLNPLWQVIFSGKHSKNLAIYLTKFFFWLSVILMFWAFPGDKSGTIFNLFTSWVGYAGFYLYGGLIANRWVDFSQHKTNLVLIGLGFALTLLGDFLTGWSHTFQQPFIWADYTGNFLSFPVILLAVGFFNYLISADFNWVKSSGKKFVAWLAGLSFGIYLIHTYVVSFLSDIISFNFDQISMNVYLYLSLNLCLVLGSSMIITLVLKTIPGIKKIIGE